MIEQLTQLLFMRLVFQQKVGEYVEGSDERDGCALQKLMSKKNPRLTKKLHGTLDQISMNSSLRGRGCDSKGKSMLHNAQCFLHIVCEKL